MTYSGKRVVGRFCAGATVALGGASLALALSTMLPLASATSSAHKVAAESQHTPLVTTSAETALFWPIEKGVSSFVTQSPARSDKAYPCGSGVNGQHILHDKDGDNTDYQESIDIVARARNTPEQSDEGRGTAITAVADGRVVAVNMTQNECDRPFGAGNYVILEHPQILVDGQPLRSAYMHLNSSHQVEQESDCGINPRPTHSENFRAPLVGELIRAGDKIGELGNTGNSTGPHLHFQFASACTLEPASEVDCPSIAVLDVNPAGFSDIRVARDSSCASALAVGSPRAPDRQSYLSDGSYVTTTSPPQPQAISASVGGP